MKLKNGVSNLYKARNILRSRTRKFVGGSSFFYTPTTKKYSTDTRPTPTPPMSRAVIAMWASEATRLHHFLWHQLRNVWLHPSLTDSDKVELINTLGQEWEPPRPSLNYDSQGRRRGAIENNNSGEDFLYMHRQMIKRTNGKLRAIGDTAYGQVKGWERIPRPGNTDYPVPPVYETGNDRFNASLARVKSDEYFNDEFIPREAKFTDPQELSQVTLGQLGALVEFTVHNWMHMRWSSSNVIGIRPDGELDGRDIDSQWNDPKYDWLGDTYSSHVHEHFWKLHGWVDDRINDWALANPDELVDGKPNWKGTWVGKMPNHTMEERIVGNLIGRFGDEVVFSALHGLESSKRLIESAIEKDSEMSDMMHEHRGHLDKMRKAARILSACGARYHIFDDIRTSLDSENSDENKSEFKS